MISYKKLTQGWIEHWRSNLFTDSFTPDINVILVFQVKEGIEVNLSLIVLSVSLRLNLTMLSPPNNQNINHDKKISPILQWRYKWIHLICIMVFIQTSSPTYFYMGGSDFCSGVVNHLLCYGRRRLKEKVILGCLLTKFLDCFKNVSCNNP